MILLADLKNNPHIYLHMDMINDKLEYLFCFNTSRFIFDRINVCTYLDRVLFLSSDICEL